MQIAGSIPSDSSTPSTGLAAGGSTGVPSFADLVQQLQQAAQAQPASPEGTKNVPATAQAGSPEASRTRPQSGDRRREHTAPEGAGASSVLPAVTPLLASTATPMPPAVSSAQLSLQLGTLASQTQPSSEAVAHPFSNPPSGPPAPSGSVVAQAPFFAPASVIVQDLNTQTSESPTPQPTQMAVQNADAASGFNTETDAEPLDEPNDAPDSHTGSLAQATPAQAMLRTEALTAGEVQAGDPSILGTNSTAQAAAPLSAIPLGPNGASHGSQDVSPASANSLQSIQQAPLANQLPSGSSTNALNPSHILLAARPVSTTVNLDAEKSTRFAQPTPTSPPATPSGRQTSSTTAAITPLPPEPSATSQTAPLPSADAAALSNAAPLITSAQPASASAQSGAPVSAQQTTSLSPGVDRLGKADDGLATSDESTGLQLTQKLSLNAEAPEAVPPPRGKTDRSGTISAGRDIAPALDGSPLQFGSAPTAESSSHSAGKASASPGPQSPSAATTTVDTPEHARTQMQVHVNTEDFGRISLTAGYGRDGVSARILLDNPQLGSMLATHAAAAQQKLSDNGLQTAVSIHSSSSPSQQGQTNPQSSDGQSSRGRTPSPSSSKTFASAASARQGEDDFATPHAASAPPMQSGRLNLHI